LSRPRVPDVGRFYPNAMAMPTPQTGFLQSNLKTVDDGESRQTALLAAVF